MIYLPLGPYHNNLCDYWEKNRDKHAGQAFWTWVRQEYGADIARPPDRWVFRNEQDAMWFAMRWG